MAVEFAVHAPPVRTATGGALVGGRVLLGSVRVGDVFTEAEGPRAAWNEPSPEVAPVRLSVVEVHVFGHLLDEVDEMYSANLLLDGEGWEALEDLVVLRHRIR